MALQSPVYHFYYTHLHFHISYLHFLPRYKSESLWLIRPLHQDRRDARWRRTGRITVLLPLRYIYIAHRQRRRYYIYTYIFIYRYGERERERENEKLLECVSEVWIEGCRLWRCGRLHIYTAAAGMDGERGSAGLSDLTFVSITHPRPPSLSLCLFAPLFRPSTKRSSSLFPPPSPLLYRRAAAPVYLAGNPLVPRPATATQRHRARIYHACNRPGGGGTRAVTPWSNLACVPYPISPPPIVRDLFGTQTAIKYRLNAHTHTNDTTGARIK